MTRVTSGQTSCELFAHYDQDSSSWRTSQDSSSSSDSFSGTWPRSGSMRSGQCFARPKLELPTDASESSSSPGLLPTPSASNPNDGEDLGNWLARREAVKARGVNGNGFGTPLSIAVRLMPTPTTQPQTGNGHARNLGNEAKPGNFGKYGPAVRQWEAKLNRKAPDPTLPDGRNGSHRLNAEFALWMQALDDKSRQMNDFTRKQKLMAAGNAVNHVQAEAAIRGLLQRAGRLA